MQKPQIIVIPQHLLSEQSKNFLRQRQVLPNTNKPIAAVMGNQRPVPAISPELKPILKRPLSPVTPEPSLKTEMSLEDQPARKRANLDHLSPEERLMRRKLKNRVAAQTARDKKKAYIDDLEAVLSKLRAEHNQTLKENSRLQEANTSLQVENASLQQQNKELQARLGQLDPTTDLLPMSPESLPRSPSPCPATSPSALSSPEPAAGDRRQAPTQESRPRVVVQRLDDLVDQLRCADVDVVGHGDAPEDEEVCVVGADELEYLADIDVFDVEDCANGGGKSAPAGYTADDAFTAEEKKSMVGEGVVADSAAPVLNLQLDLQQHEESNLMESEAALFLNTPDPDKLFDLDTEKTVTAMDSDEATKFLNELWLESNLESVDNWNEDNLFPDLI